MNLTRPGCNRKATDDDELIASLAGGDDTALRELFTRHAPWLAARLRAVLPASDVEDVLQETFLAVWKNARTYRPRAVAVFAVNAVLGLAASAASGAVASLTFGWLLPMTAICGLTLAVAVAARSATVGAVGGVAAWVITVLANQSASGQLTATVTDTETYLPYLAAAAVAAVAVAYVTRPQRGLQ